MDGSISDSEVIDILRGIHKRDPFTFAQSTLDSAETIYSDAVGYPICPVLTHWLHFNCLKLRRIIESGSEVNQDLYRLQAETEYLTFEIFDILTRIPGSRCWPLRDE